jgi:hypothetical protein
MWLQTLATDLKFNTHLYSTYTSHFTAWCTYSISQDTIQFHPQLFAQKVNLHSIYFSLISLIPSLAPPPPLFLYATFTSPELYLQHKFRSISDITLIYSHTKISPIKVYVSTTLSFGCHLNQCSCQWIVDVQYKYQQGPLHSHFSLKTRTVLNHTSPNIRSPLNNSSHTLIIFRWYKIPLEKRSCITDEDRLVSESCLVLRFEVTALLGVRFRFNTSVKRLEE